MPLASHEMVRRGQAVDATVARFVGKPFQWGKNDCARMAVFHLRQLGYRPRLFKVGSYSTALGARGALRRAGFKSLPDALKAQGLVEIAPASAWLGDILLMASEDGGLPSMAIQLNNGRILGFREVGEIGDPVEVMSAWRG